MFPLIAKFVIAFPKMGRLFFELLDRYEKQKRIKRHNRNTTLINNWVRNPNSKQDSDSD